MRIYVNGTTVSLEGEGVPFDVDDFPGLQDGKVLHWDGLRWWYETDTASAVEVLAAMFVTSPDMMKQIPDGTLSRMAAYMQPWASGMAYAVGDLREYMELPYRCLQAHTSQETWTPTDAPSLWAKVLRSPDIPEWEQPSSTNPYMKGDKVKHNGKVWESLIDNNVWEPGAVGTESLWAEVN